MRLTVSTDAQIAGIRSYVISLTEVDGESVALLQNRGTDSQLRIDFLSRMSLSPLDREHLVT